MSRPRAHGALVLAAVLSVGAVVERDGRLGIDRFESCAVGEATLQLLVHAEAPAADTDRDRFAATVDRESAARVAELAGEADVLKVRCHAIASPAGDVDHEIEIRIQEGHAQVTSVDVAKRNTTIAMGYLARQRRARGGGAEPEPGPCASTVMGQTFCAHSPQGVAVTTTMGEVVCARGNCVREASGKWHCARRAGGWAELTPTGPRCEQGCYEPTSRQCRMV